GDSSSVMYALICCIQPAPPVLSPLSLHDALPISGGAGLDHDRMALCRARHREWPARGEERSLVVEPLHLARIGEAAARLVDHQRSEEHTSELQSRFDLVCRLLLEKQNHLTSDPSY